MRVKLFQSFINAPKQNEEFWEGWSYFSMVFPIVVCDDDKNLKKLLRANTFINERWHEVKSDVVQSMESDFIELPFSDVPILSEEELFKRIVSIAHTNVVSFLLPTNEMNSDNLDLNDDLIRKFFAELIESAPDGLDKSLSDIGQEHLSSNANFQLDNKNLFYELERWDQPVIRSHKTPKVTTQLIKQVDHFDPSVYELIKKDPELLTCMDWRLFEELLADILKTFGYTIELTRKTKDGGIDVIAIKSEDDFGPHKYILQAKR
jgi:hypothetical protein